METEYPVLEFLKKFISEANTANPTKMKYPTAISQTLGFEILSVERQKACIAINADPAKHGNQQGTIHGGLLCELADAAIGTAHSTVMLEKQSFTTLELKINFIRPTWEDRLIADASPIYSGKTISHYQCQIHNQEKKLIATVLSTIMTLSGDKAAGR